MSDLFGKTQATYRQPQEPIVRRALMEGRYRRWLFRGWSSGPVALWGMLNPSRGSADRDDPTLWQVMKISCRLGFGSAYVVNVYPLISADPAEMREWRLSFTDMPFDGHDGWTAYLRNQVDAADLCRRCDAHFAAWGDGLATRTDLRDWLEAIDNGLERELDWLCFGVNASGSPKHPLARGRHRIPDDAQPVAWVRPKGWSRR